MGHEIDRSICDEVAQRCFKTPTATAQALVECVRTYAGSLDQLQHRLGTGIRNRLAGLDVNLDRQLARLRGGAMALAGRRSADVDRFALAVAAAPRRRLAMAETKLDGVAAQVRALDPARVLAAGLLHHPRRRRCGGAGRRGPGLPETGSPPSWPPGGWRASSSAPTRGREPVAADRPVEELGFEEARAELEAIVAAIDHGDVDLDTCRRRWPGRRPARPLPGPRSAATRAQVEDLVASRSTTSRRSRPWRPDRPKSFDLDRSHEPAMMTLPEHENL